MGIGFVFWVFFGFKCLLVFVGFFCFLVLLMVVWCLRVWWRGLCLGVGGSLSVGLLSGSYMVFGVLYWFGRGFCCGYIFWGFVVLFVVVVLGLVFT